MRESEGYVLRDKDKRILTTEEGFPRLWLDRIEAREDAKLLSDKLGITLRSVKFPGVKAWEIQYGHDIRLGPTIIEEKRIPMSLKKLEEITGEFK
jgi:hypothetical protein